MVRVARVAVPGMLATSLVAGGIAFAGQPQETVVAAPAPTASASDTLSPDRSDRPNRDSGRTPVQSPSATSTPSASPSATETKKPSKKPTKKASPKPTKTKTPEPEVVGSRYTTVDLNVRSKASDGGELVTVLDAGDKMKITDQTSGEWQQIQHDAKFRWVRGQYLSSEKPETGPSSGECAGGSEVESGLTPDAIKVHRAICNKFPAVTSYGGVRSDSLPEHPSGRALDAMVSNTGLGWEIANWLQANASSLGISEILFDQKIWTVQRGGEGWRGMSNRGGATANHRDHVHVSVYGNSAN